MSKNPYKILNVSPTASDEVIENAYLELQKKYDPHRYGSEPDLAALAKERAEEVKAAYDEICRLRGIGAFAETKEDKKEKREESRNAYGANRGQEGGANGYGQRSYSGAAGQRFFEIRNAINSGNIRGAEQMLNTMDYTDRNAEWFFLTGCVQMKKGNYVDAQRSFETAHTMDPNNQEYWQFKEQARNRAGNFGGGYRTSGGSGSTCDMCSTLILADCCCECMGGDLISCC